MHATIAGNATGCFYLTPQPEPATNIGVSGVRSNDEKEHTFAMDPQERRVSSLVDPWKSSGRELPLFKDTALEEPGRCSVVVGLACDVMIYGGIRRSEILL